MSNITQSHQHRSQTTVMKLVTIFIDDKKSELSPFYKHINFKLFSKTNYYVAYIKILVLIACCVRLYQKMIASE